MSIHLLYRVLFFTENEEEHTYVIHRNSPSSENNDVRPHQPTNSNYYTDIRFSRMEPDYCNTMFTKNGIEPETLSVSTIPSHGVENNRHENNEDDIDESGFEY